LKLRRSWKEFLKAVSQKLMHNTMDNNLLEIFCTKKKFGGIQVNVEIGLCFS